MPRRTIGRLEPAFADDATTAVRFDQSPDRRDRRMA